jgi:hypothetical protein
MMASASLAGTAAQIATLHGSIKTLTKRLASMEEANPAQPAAKRARTAGTGHWSQHDMQKANFRKELGSAIRVYLDVEQQGVEVDGLESHGLETFFDPSVGMCTHLVRCGCLCVLY